jgi:TonB-linked SusC/RagA family outer membrane protein
MKKCKRKKMMLWLLCSMLMTSISGFAQRNITVQGTVKDEADETLIGATVIEKGKKVGTMTDDNGHFSLTVAEKAELQVSYLGFITKSVPVNNNTSIDIVLSEDIHNIEEVLVIGYGTMKKKDLTGSVTGMKSDDIMQSKAVSFVNAMQGRMAGVHISSQSGELGANSRISIRGANSVYGSSLPLYVIDGIQMDVNTDEVVSAKMGNGSQLDPLSSLNPADIESIEILKDASATAIYGSRGANGVILVTTRSGKAGKSRISYDGNINFGIVSKRLKVLGASDFIDYRRTIEEFSPLFYTDSNSDGSYDALDNPRDPYSNPSHNWQNEMLRTAVSHNHNLSLDGGTEKTQYSTSLGYTMNEGIIINNNYQRITARLKLDHQATNRLRTGTNLSTSYSTFKGASQSGGEGGSFNGIVQSLVTARPVEIYIPSWDMTGTYVSPISMLESAYKSTSFIRANVNAYVDYTIMDGLTLNISAGGILSSSKGNEFYGKNTEWGAGDNGRAIIAEHRAYYISNTEQLSYKKNFGWSSLDAMLAAEVNHYNYESFGVDNGNYLDESTGAYSISKGSVLKSLYSYRGINNRVSYLARVYYDLYNRYLFTASIRADGSDKFGKGNRYGYFPSLAVAWRVSEEKFMKTQKFIDNLKLRLSYGQTGNERIASYQYMANMENSYYNGVLGLSPSTMANPNLKWETTIQYNAGIDLGIFKNRVQITVDAYKKITNDMLMPAPIPSQSGFSTQWQNIGRVDNQGVELQLSTVNISTKNFEWTTNFNISTNKNTVKDLGGVDYIPVNIGGGWITNVGRVIVGHEIGTAYGYVFDGVYQLDDFTWQNNSDPSIPFDARNFTLKPDVVSVSGTNVKPGSFKFKNLDGSADNVVDENDQTIISRSTPKFFGGINNTFKYKGFELSIFLVGSYGNEIFNESRFRLEGGTPIVWLNLSQDFWDNRWTPDNPTNEYGTFSVDTKNTTSMKTSSYYVENASFLRLKTLSLAYNVPADFLKKIRWSNISNLRLYATADNLYTWTKYTGFDPEIDSNNALLPGFDRISYPRTRTFIFGVNITF